MLKVLLKKSFKELAYTYFRSKKQGTSLNKKSTIGKIILFIFLYGFLAVSFYGIATGVGGALFPVDLYWLYFALFAIISVVLGMILNMFMAKSFLYEAKDNEILLSLPLDTRDIVISRFVTLYINNLLYTSIVYLPAVLNYCLYTKKFVAIILGIIILLFINLFASALATLLGYGVAMISKLLNNSSTITTICSLAFLGAYYYFYFNFEKYLNTILADYQKYEEAIKGKLYILYCVGEGQLGDLKSILVFALFCLAIYGIIFYFVDKSFVSIVTFSASSKAKKFDSKQIKSRNVTSTLIHRELKRYLTNSTYTLNCGLGIVVLFGLAIAGFIKKEYILNTLAKLALEAPDFAYLAPLFVPAFIISILSMDALSVPAISLEGINYWIIRSLPVDTYDVLQAKRILQVRLHIVPVVVLSFVSTIVLDLTGSSQVYVVMLSVISLVFLSNLHLLLGLLFGNINWTSETVAIKQNLGVLVAMLAGYGLTALCLLGGYYAKNFLNLESYMLVLIVIFVLLTKLIDQWIRVYGVKKFEELG